MAGMETREHRWAIRPEAPTPLFPGGRWLGRRLTGAGPTLVDEVIVVPEQQLRGAVEDRRVLAEAITDALADLRPGVAPYSVLSDALARVTTSGGQ